MQCWDGAQGSWECAALEFFWPCWAKPQATWSEFSAGHGLSRRLAYGLEANLLLSKAFSPEDPDTLSDFQFVLDLHLLYIAELQRCLELHHSDSNAFDTTSAPSVLLFSILLVWGFQDLVSRSANRWNCERMSGLMWSSRVLPCFLSQLT